MDDALKKVRESAVGVELDEKLAAQFPIRETRTLELPGGRDRDDQAAARLRARLPGAAHRRLAGGGDADLPDRSAAVRRKGISLS